MLFNDSSSSRSVSSSGTEINILWIQQPRAQMINKSAIAGLKRILQIFNLLQIQFNLN